MWANVNVQEKKKRKGFYRRSKNKHLPTLLYQDFFMPKPSVGKKAFIEEVKINTYQLYSTLLSIIAMYITSYKDIKNKSNEQDNTGRKTCNLRHLHKRQWRVVSGSLPHEHIGLIILSKLCQNFCLFRWLKSSLKPISSLTPLTLSATKP